MRQGQSSRTAAWVAGARTLGGLLPELSLVEDPYGIRFVEGPVRRLAEGLLTHPAVARAVLPRTGPLFDLLSWMQLRTRALDDVVVDFVRSGGRQLVLLGAGYDCRALRLAHELADTSVIEVDHPSTQAQKCAVVGDEASTWVRYVAWDFESHPVAQLPERLASEGLDPKARTLTLWEGVAAYLSEGAIDQTLRAVHAYGAPGSVLAFTYVHRSAIKRPRNGVKVWSKLASSAGEPWRFGFDPETLGAWLATRGYVLEHDHSDLALARALLGDQARSSTRHHGTHHVAIARTVTS